VDGAEGLGMVEFTLLAYAQEIKEEKFAFRFECDAKVER
jgi:hypothetical protein